MPQQVATLEGDDPNRHSVERNKATDEAERARHTCAPDPFQVLSPGHFEGEVELDGWQL